MDLMSIIRGRRSVRKYRPDPVSQEKIDQALEAARLAPQWPDPLNNLAWTLATDPRSYLRNGVEAVRLAERAVGLSGTNSVGSLDTLAAAYAEAGRFSEAVATAEAAVTLAKSCNQSALAREIESRLALYRAGQQIPPPIGLCPLSRWTICGILVVDSFSRCKTRGSVFFHYRE